MPVTPVIVTDGNGVKHPLVRSPDGIQAPQLPRVAVDPCDCCDAVTCSPCNRLTVVAVVSGIHNPDSNFCNDCGFLNGAFVLQSTGSCIWSLDDIITLTCFGLPTQFRRRISYAINGTHPGPYSGSGGYSLYNSNANRYEAIFTGQSAWISNPCPPVAIAGIDGGPFGKNIYCWGGGGTMTVTP